MKAIGGPTIGLLGGMGVKATAPFLELVIDECRKQYGAVHQEEFPQMVIFSWPSPIRMDIPLDHPVLSARIAEGVRRICSCGIDFLAIPANLPHMYWSRLKAAATVPLLNMIEVVADAIPSELKILGLAATRPTRDSRLYHNPLEQRGLRLVATDRMQDVVDGLLTALWRGEDPRLLQQKWKDVVQFAAEEGAEAILLACTDLNAIPDWQDVSLPVLDATRILAAKVVSTWLEKTAL